MPSMTPYDDHSGHSGVAAYRVVGDALIVLFKQGGLYRYDAEKPGPEAVAQMRVLAKQGIGLATYINRHVRGNCTRL